MTQPHDEVDALLAGGGAPVFKFPQGQHGTTINGTIIAKAATDQTDLNGKVKTFDSGEVMRQIVLTLATDLRDPGIADDDGSRRVFFAGQAFVALRNAVAAANARTIDIGGTVAVQYTHDTPPKQAGFHPTKQFAVAYKPAASSPTATAAAPSVDDLV